MISLKEHPDDYQRTAEVIGKGLSSKRGARNLSKNVAARRAFYDRFAELDSFEAWERPVVVAEATKHASAIVLIVWPSQP